MNVIKEMPIANIEHIKEMEEMKDDTVIKGIAQIGYAVCPANRAIATSALENEGMRELPTCLMVEQSITANGLDADALVTTKLQFAQFETQFDDSDIDLPPFEWYEDPHGDDENCDYEYDDCPNKVEYWVSPAASDGDGGLKPRYYCPKHFALQLHSIIDDMRSDQWISGQENQAKRRDAIHSYFIRWGHIG